MPDGLRLLTVDELRKELASLPAWDLKHAKLYRKKEFSTYKDSASALANIALVADKQNHHPDIVWQYTTVEFFLSTHDFGGITKKDLMLAAEIEKILKN